MNMNRTGNTASYRILEFLTRHRGTAFSNPDIAQALSLPADSVRRVMNVLKAQARVYTSVPGGRQWQISSGYSA